MHRLWYLAKILHGGKITYNMKSLLAIDEFQFLPLHLLFTKTSRKWNHTFIHILHVLYHLDVWRNVFFFKRVFRGNLKHWSAHELFRLRQDEAANHINEVNSFERSVNDEWTRTLPAGKTSTYYN